MINLYMFDKCNWHRPDYLRCYLRSWAPAIARWSNGCPVGNQSKAAKNPQCKYIVNIIGWQGNWGTDYLADEDRCWKNRSNQQLILFLISQIAGHRPAMVTEAIGASHVLYFCHLPIFDHINSKQGKLCLDRLYTYGNWIMNTIIYFNNK